MAGTAEQNRARGSANSRLLLHCSPDPGCFQVATTCAAVGVGSGGDAFGERRAERLHGCRRLGRREPAPRVRPPSESPLLTRAMLDAGTAPRPSPPAKKARCTDAGSAPAPPAPLAPEDAGTSSSCSDVSDTATGAGAEMLRWTSCSRRMG